MFTSNVPDKVTLPVTSSNVPSNVKLAESSISPLVPAKTTRPDVKSLILALARVLSPVTPSVPETVASSFISTVPLKLSKTRLPETVSIVLSVVTASCKLPVSILEELIPLVISNAPETLKSPVTFVSLSSSIVPTPCAISSKLASESVMLILLPATLILSVFNPSPNISPVTFIFPVTFALLLTIKLSVSTVVASMLLTVNAVKVDCPVTSKVPDKVKSTLSILPKTTLPGVPLNTSEAFTASGINVNFSSLLS